jgi:hypothetical protein
VLTVIYHEIISIFPYSDGRFLGNNPSAVMFFQRFIFSAKKFREKYLERIWVFHCRYSIRKKPRVIVLALSSKMM